MPFVWPTSPSIGFSSAFEGRLTITRPPTKLSRRLGRPQSMQSRSRAFCHVSLNPALLTQPQKPSRVCRIGLF